MKALSILHDARSETMKTLKWLTGIWAALLICIIVCDSKSELLYTICYDTKNNASYEIKEKVQDVYNDLVSGVHSDSYVIMVMNNLDHFEFAKDIKAEWKNNQLYIVQGNGKGSEIHGTLETYSVCVPKVQPRSFLQEIFSGF